MMYNHVESVSELNPKLLQYYFHSLFV